MNDGIGMTTLSRILALDEPERADIVFIEDLCELCKASAKRTPLGKRSCDTVGGFGWSNTKKNEKGGKTG
ncbi:hypothetical protein SBF1_6010004 [Candidatus Desulfosporosinus infrequens]|uniref:Uncharacterized protein n=1 Tax=Candidatus Desulfosporosinus infrequens TaxID=2043169 RepID=A0A2U3LL47_9FIRM|nr:hypothetical protein SBF1_6010004 [Candidatus Desulfosporosinus infrequens]